MKPMQAFAPLLTAVSLAALPLAAPAAAQAPAQSQAEERVNTLIIYGDDDCPQSQSDEIVVCARMDEGERYRIPERLRESSSPQNEAWTTRVRSFETVGRFGPMSCTPVGAGGELGCTAQAIEQAYAARAQSSEVRFGQLIEQARQERLSTIDAEAAETQARVEVLEREYLDRVRREQEAEQAPAETPAVKVQPAAPLSTPPRP